MPASGEHLLLLLIHDKGLLSESLSYRLASEPDFELIGQCSSSAEALDVLSRSPVDMVLLDFDIGGERGEQFLTSARNISYQGKFFIVTSEVDAARSAAALQLGASGIFLTSNSSTRLVQAIRLAAAGEVCIDQRVIRTIAEAYPRHAPRLSSFTPREQQVLQGLLDGLTSKKIGVKAGVSESTIKSVIQSLFVKMGVRTRGQLVRAALEDSIRSHVNGDFVLEERRFAG
jgi:two-component system, NarL family, nitrate/nitrite response regulator NarL